MPLSSIVAADLGAILTHLGSTVVYGATTGVGYLKKSHIEIASDVGLTPIDSNTTLIIRTGDFGTITNESTITVDGASYKVRFVGPVQRDQTQTLYLVAA